MRIDLHRARLVKGTGFEVGSRGTATKPATSQSHSLPLVLLDSVQTAINRHPSLTLSKLDCCRL